MHTLAKLHTQPYHCHHHPSAYPSSLVKIWGTGDSPPPGAFPSGITKPQDRSRSVWLSIRARFRGCRYSWYVLFLRLWRLTLPCRMCLFLSLITLRVGCKAFGGQRYVCTASCTVTRDDKSASEFSFEASLISESQALRSEFGIWSPHDCPPPAPLKQNADADGGMTFKNCQMYTDRMGESELDSAKVDVVVSNLYSYYHQATVTIRKQTSKTTATQRVVTWPERVGKCFLSSSNCIPHVWLLQASWLVLWSKMWPISDTMSDYRHSFDIVDVMGYKANTPHDGKPLSLYQCPLSDKANLPRPCKLVFKDVFPKCVSHPVG